VFIEGIKMQKKQLLKLFVTILIVIFALFLNGCVIYVGTPIVKINIANDYWTYEIYVDGSYVGETDKSGNLVLYSISSGYHYFEAEDTSFLNRYGDKWQKINEGYNIVNIYTY